MILSDLRTEILNRINNDTTTGTTANLNRWINLAQDEVESRLLSRVLRNSGSFATEANVDTYAVMEINFRSFVQLWQTDSPSVMTQIDTRAFRRVVPDPESSGIPLWWMFLGYTSGFPQVQLYYIPDTTYTINYEFLSNLADLSADGDESILSHLGYDELLIQGAFIRYLQVKDTQRYMVEKGRFDELLRHYRQELQPSIDLGRRFADWLGDDSVEGATAKYPPSFPPGL